MKCISPTLEIVERFRALGCQIRGGDELILADRSGIGLRPRPPRGEWQRIESLPITLLRDPDESAGADERATDARNAPAGPFALRPASDGSRRVVLVADRPLAAAGAPDDPLDMAALSSCSGGNPTARPGADEIWDRSLLMAARRLGRRRPLRDLEILDPTPLDPGDHLAQLGAAGFEVSRHENALRISIARRTSLRVARLEGGDDGPRLSLPFVAAGQWSEVSQRAATVVAVHATRRLRLVRIVVDRGDPALRFRAEVHFGALPLGGAWLDRGLAALVAADAWLADEFGALADPTVAAAVLEGWNQRI